VFLADKSSSTVKDGTSMAAAHVTGVAALYLERNPTMSSGAVRDAIIADSSKEKLLWLFQFFSPNRISGVD
jgi:subtilisin family serine protease